MDILKARKKAKEKKLKEKKDLPSEKKTRELADSEVFENGLKKAVGKQLGELSEKLIEEKKEEKPQEKEFAPIEMREEIYQETEKKVEEIPFLDVATAELYRRVTEEEAEKEGEEFLIFSSGGELYAVEIKNIREVVKLRGITEVPKTPPYILGICSVRGNIVPLLDLRKRMNLTQKAVDIKENSKIIIFSFQRDLVGMIVDEVKGVKRILREKMEPIPPTLPQEQAEFFQCLIRDGNEIISALNIKKVFEFLREEEAV